jgi:hypothetical protein
MIDHILVTCFVEVQLSVKQHHRIVDEKEEYKN